jgi:hypothetical protein
MRVGEGGPAIAFMRIEAMVILTRFYRAHGHMLRLLANVVHIMGTLRLVVICPSCVLHIHPSFYSVFSILATHVDVVLSFWIACKSR